MKRVLVISTSPRVKSNSDALADEFIRGAKEAGHEVEKISIRENAIINKFGADKRFYTCSAENMTAAELVAFLEAKGKFMPAEGDGFTADRSKMCNH